MSEKFFGIILLRSGSRRIKNKNFIKIQKKMMFQHILDEAIKSNIFSKIHLSTESFQKFKSLGKLTKNKKYKIVDINPIRAKKLSQNHIPMFEVVKNIINHHDRFENLVLIYATGLMIDVKDFKNMARIFLHYKKKNKNSSTSLQTIGKYTAPLEWAYHLNKNKGLIPLNKKTHLISSDKFKKAFFDTGGLHFISKSFLTSSIKKKYYGYELPYQKSIDIDQKEDLEFIKKLKQIF